MGTYDASNRPHPSPDFSQSQGITPAAIWTAVFVFMASALVIAGVGILQAR
jgi:hypothetical protein